MKRGIKTSFAKLVEVVKNNIPKEWLRNLKTIKEENLITLHMTLGMWMRNKFYLWNTEIIEDPFMHTDDLSQKIIETIWKELQ